MFIIEQTLCKADVKFLRGYTRLIGEWRNLKVFTISRGRIGNT